MNCRRLRPAIVDSDEHEDVIRPRLRVFHEHVEIAVVIEDAGVEQLELGSVLAPAPVLLHELRVREFPLRILVEHSQVGMRRSGVEVVVKLLSVLAVVALGVGQSENAFLEDRVFTIPQSERKTEALGIIADAGQTVLAPTIRAAACMVVREMLPGIAVRRVIFPHRAPLALGEVRTPTFPVLPTGFGLIEALLFAEFDIHSLTEFSDVQAVASARAGGSLRAGLAGGVGLAGSAGPTSA